MTTFDASKNMAQQDEEQKLELFHLVAEETARFSDRLQEISGSNILNLAFAHGLAKGLMYSIVAQLSESCAQQTGSCVFADVSSGVFEISKNDRETILCSAEQIKLS